MGLIILKFLIGFLKRYPDVQTFDVFSLSNIGGIAVTALKIIHN